MPNINQLITGTNTILTDIASGGQGIGASQNVAITSPLDGNGSLKTTLTIGGAPVDGSNPLAVSATSLPLPSGAGRDSTLQSILAAIQATVNITGTVWFDPTLSPVAYYIRRESVNESNQTITISWYNPNGTAATPTIGNLQAVSNSSSVTAENITYTANTNGSGYNNGDIILHTYGIDTTTSPATVLYSFWFDATNSSVLSSAPPSGNLNSTTQQVSGSVTLGAGSATIGNVGITNFPTTQIISGVVTAQGISFNSSGLALEAGHLQNLDSATGTTTDVAVSSDSNGTISAKIRGLVKILASVWDNANGRLKVDGSAVTQPISAASLPLPSGAATDANLTVVQSSAGTSASKAITVQGNVSGVALPISGTVNVGNFPSTQAVTASSLPLPSGASTAALQSNVQSNVGVSSVQFLNVQGNVNGIPLPISGTISVSNFPVSETVTISSTPLPPGAAVAALQSNVQSPVGTSNVSAITIQGNSSGIPIPVSGTIGVSSLPALPAGANNIGSVSVSNFINTIGVTGSVSVLNFPSTQTIAGSVTANAGTNLNTSLLALETGGNLATTVTKLNSILTKFGSGTLQYDGSNNLNVNIQAGTVSVSNFPATQPISGTVAVSSLPAIPTGSNTIGNVGVTSLPALPTGTNSIGAVTINNFPGTQPVSAASLPLPTGAATAANQTNVQTGPGSAATTAITIQGNASGIAVPMSGTVSVNSLPAIPAGTNTIGNINLGNASWQTATWTSGTSTGTNLAINCQNFSTSILTITTPSTLTGGVVQFSGYDGTNWVQLAGSTDGTLTASSISNAASPYTLVANQTIAIRFNTTAYQQFRVYLSTAITGAGNTVLQLGANAGTLASGTVNISGTPNVSVTSLPALPTGSNVIGQVTANAGTNLNTSLLALETGGNLAAILTKFGSGTLQYDGSNNLKIAVQGTVPVSGTFWQATQPVSLSSLPSLAAGGALIGKVGIDQTTPGTTNAVSISSTDLAPATQNITTVDSGSTTTSGNNSQSLITGTPTAGSVASFAISSQEGLKVMVSGTWTGTLQSEISLDGGTTWSINGVYQTGTAYTIATFTANFIGDLNVSGVTNFRLRATAAITGTAVVKIVTSLNINSIHVANGINIQDSSVQSQKLSVSAAGAAKITTDQSAHGTSDLVADDIVKVGGNTVATAASGIMKVGLTDGTGNAITSTSNAIDVNIKSGGAGGSNAAASATGSTVPSNASYTGFSNVSGNLVGVSATNPLPITGSISVSPTTDSAPSTVNITTQDIGSITTLSANNQGLITGTATTNSFASFTTSSQEAVRVMISGTWTGTLQGEISLDGGTTWALVELAQTGLQSTITTFTGNLIATANVAGATNFRIRATSVVTGTAVVRITGTINVGGVQQQSLGAVGYDNNVILSTAVSSAGAGAALSTNSYSLIALDLSGNWAGTLQIEGSNGSGQWYPLIVKNSSDDTSSDIISGQGVYYLNPTTSQIRYNVKSVYGTINANVVGKASAGPSFPTLLTQSFDTSTGVQQQVNIAGGIKVDQGQALMLSDQVLSFQPPATGQIYTIDTLGYSCITFASQSTGGTTLTLTGCSNDRNANYWDSLYGFTIGSAIQAPTTTLSSGNSYVIPCLGRYVRFTTSTAGGPFSLVLKTVPPPVYMPWVNIGAINGTLANAASTPGALGVTPIPGSVPTATFVYFNGALSNTPVAVKASQGTIHRLHFFNAGASVAYVQVFNLAVGSVTLGTTAPTDVFGVPAGGGIVLADVYQETFSTAITIAATTTYNGSTAPGTAILSSVRYM